MKRALLIAVVACGPSTKNIADHNQHSVARADQATAAAGPAFEAPHATVPASLAPVSRPAEDEALYADPATGQLVFVSSACAVRARCGNDCVRPVEYTYHHASNGHVVIVRRRVIQQVVRTEDDPSCPAGCGGGARPSEPEPPTVLAGFGLGVHSPDQIELRSVTYTEQIVMRVCTNTDPVP
jgi:hypothetical protein